MEVLLMDPFMVFLKLVKSPMKLDNTPFLDGLSMAELEEMVEIQEGLHKIRQKYY